MHHLLFSSAHCTCGISKFPAVFPLSRPTQPRAASGGRRSIRAESRSDGLDAPTVEEEQRKPAVENSDSGKPPTPSSASPTIGKDIKKVVQKTAATFAPRASTATKNPAVPGSALYTIFEVQAIPSLRARDCSNKEKEALNYLFLLIPLINIFIPFFWKSFAVVWSADTIAFFVMYAWKLGWLQSKD